MYVNPRSSGLAEFYVGTTDTGVLSFWKVYIFTVS